MTGQVPERNWQTYYAGQLVKCPGRRLGDRRRAVRGIPDGDRRSDCGRVLVRVGVGEIWRVRWLGMKGEIPMTFNVTTHSCRDCDAVCEVKVEQIARTG